MSSSAAVLDNHRCNNCGVLLRVRNQQHGAKKEKRRTEEKWKNKELERKKNRKKEELKRSKKNKKKTTTTRKKKKEEMKKKERDKLEELGALHGPQGIRPRNVLFATLSCNVSVRLRRNKAHQRNKAV